MSGVEAFDPFAPETVEDPYPFYAALRREAPVYELPGGAYHVVSRFEDCQRIALEPETFSSNLVAAVLADTARSPEVVELSSGGPKAVDVLAIADDPAHARQRKLSNKAFSPRRVAAMEPAVRALVKELIDGFEADGRTDWMQTVAAELPTRIVCELIGLPEGDGAQLRKWAYDGSAILSGLNTPDDFRRLALSVMQLSRYLDARVKEALDAPGNDVLGALARAAREGPEHERLSEDEVVFILVQLLGAGTESTNALLGSALMLLLTTPGLRERLSAEPARIPDFVEEALRLESPFQGHFRLVKRDTVVAGSPLPEGTRLMLLWGSANRDERRFERADELDIDRPDVRSHLAFGFGTHHCIGASLARLEARIAIEAILDRTRDLRIADGARLRHVPSLMIRRLEALPIGFGSR